MIFIISSMLNLLILPVSLAIGFQQGSDSLATLQVDASEAPMHIIHTTETLPVVPGPLTVCYAKWIPGEHMPSGPIANLVNLHFYSGNAEIEWRRDLVEMNNFHLNVPSGSGSLTIKLDYVTANGGDFGSSLSTDSDLGVINWYENALWPQGVVPDQIKVAPTLKVPSGWKTGGSLDVDQVAGDMVRYTPTSVAQLNDHPVVMGLHYRRIDLFPSSADVGEHAIDIIADSDWALQVPTIRIENYKRLVREERAVFGGVGHYRKYHWLLTLSDNLGAFGVEHHECADDRAPEATMVDDNLSRALSSLLPHEFFHSWNGKTLRPSGLINGGYENPMKDDGLWVYEGMTNYYGEVLAARCGLMSPADYAEQLAADYASVSGPGRTWRPLQDTADSAPYLYASPPQWSGVRRGTDFYAEGSLIWLEADAKIRQLTHGAKSLDDFCALFEGGPSSGKAYVRPYEIGEVFDALNRVVPNDWHAFFGTRLTAKTDLPPDGGLTACGYHLTYNDEPNFFISVDPRSVNALTSLGLSLSTDGAVLDCWPGSPAYKAGIAVGSKIISINGREFSGETLRHSIMGAEHTSAPMEFIVKDGPQFKVIPVDYHKGLRYPHLERTQGSADILGLISAPRSRS